MPKKNNPGCNCCENADCLNRCLYKCQTPPCVFACAIKIDTPESDDVNTTSGVTCAPQECEITAKCNACKRIFDGIFSFGGTLATGWSRQETGECDDYTITFTMNNDPPFETDTSWFCWTYYDYLCPDDSYLYNIPNPCSPQYGIRDPQVIVRITYDGTCSTTEVELKYKVFETCNSVGIPPNPPTDPETEYTHLYRRSNQCDCDEILGAFTFISTTSVNNSRGITVPDVCNLDGASISLVDQTNCNCHCFHCQIPSTQRTLTVTGDYAGTYLLNYITSYKDPFCIEGITDVYCNRFCVFESSVFGGNQKWILYIECLPCEKYNIYLVLDGTIGHPDDPFVSYARALGVDCAETIALSETIEEGATFDLS